MEMNSIYVLQRLAELASPVERTASKMFYYEVHRFVCWLAGVSNMEPQVVAAVVATLSPRNDWMGNQLDAIALCCGCDPVDGYGAIGRDIDHAKRLVGGSVQGAIVTGPKRLAFYYNITHPGKWCVGIPVDIHLSRALWGWWVTAEHSSRLLGTVTRYRVAEATIIKAALLMSMRPIEFANRLWFVCRRLYKDKQHEGQRVVDGCAGLVGHDWKPDYPGGEYRHQLGTSTPKMNLLPGCSYRPWLLDLEHCDAPSWGSESVEGKGWVYVSLGKDHPYAMSNGRCSRGRLLVQYVLGRQLRVDEHVDHGRGGMRCDELSNLEVVSPEYHGRKHGSAFCVARCDTTGRFRELVPGVDDGCGREFMWPRQGAVLGNQALS